MAAMTSKTKRVVATVTGTAMFAAGAAVMIFPVIHDLAARKWS